MSFLKNAGLTLCGLLGLASVSKGQISEEQARPIDSLLANNYLTSPTFHSPSLLSPNLYVWTAGSGFYYSINDFYVNWTHKGKVHPDTIAMANSMPGQILEPFDLDQFETPNAYKIAVENWLQSIGINVGINEHKQLEHKLFPNPIDRFARLQANIQPGKEYSISVYDLSGRLVDNYNGITNEKGLNVELDFLKYAKGMYLIQFSSEDTSFSTKGKRQ